MKLVPATEGDIQFAEHLVIGNMGWYFREFGIEWDPKRFEKNWSKSENYILQSRDTKVGFVSLIFDSKVSYISDLQVRSGFQGQGYGSRIIRHVEQISMSRGLYRLRLRVFLSNPAIELYQRLGFRIEIREEITVGMEKVLFNQ